MARTNIRAEKNGPDAGSGCVYFPMFSSGKRSPDQFRFCRPNCILYEGVTGLRLNFDDPLKSLGEFAPIVFPDIEITREPKHEIQDHLQLSRVLVVP